LQAQENDSIKNENQKLISYGSKGFELNSIDGNYLMQIQWRGQFRAAYPTDSDPVTLEDFQADQLSLKIRRARMKVGGHAFTPWLKYYLENELFSANLLDFRLMIEKLPYLKIKVGQWKTQYNRERIISSGKQQTVERSLITRPFTIDRQQGVSVFGRLDGNGLLDFNYWVSVLMGTGRGATSNDDGRLMYMSRIQWNFTGEPLQFAGSDVDFHEKFTAILAIAGVTNRSPYTRFSQAGGGQLFGFEDGVTGQYRVNQWMEETAGMYKGFSWQQEFHWKEIRDHVNFTTTRITGNLIQAGYFPHYRFQRFPKQIEIYARHAFYDPDVVGAEDLQHELTVGGNYFFHKHRNKLTLEYSYFNYSLESEELQSGSRYRLQWDVSF
jgi:hypothetical protein